MTYKVRHHYSLPLRTPQCKFFYERQDRTLDEIINELVLRCDIERIKHLLECPDCRLYQQIRNQFSSETMMDIELRAALSQLQNA